MGTTMDMVARSPQNDSVENYGEELRKLEAERDEIIADAGRAVSKVFGHLERQKQRRIKIASDFRDVQLKNLYKQYRAEIQQAADELTRGKRQLQSAMLDIAAEKRQRIDSVLRQANAMPLPAAISRKRRRGKNGLGERVRGTGRAGFKRVDSFIDTLENQGLFRIALTPDEVNVDLQMILRKLETSVRPNGGVVSPSLDRRAAEANVRNVEKIHSSKGTLHYHDIKCEKGDRVCIFSGNAPKASAKYSGVILSVNSKEVTIRGDDGKFFFFFFNT